MHPGEYDTVELANDLKKVPYRMILESKSKLIMKLMRREAHLSILDIAADRINNPPEHKPEVKIDFMTYNDLVDPT